MGLSCSLSSNSFRLWLRLAAGLLFWKGASNWRLVSRHIEALRLKFNQVLFYGAVRNTWISTWSARYPAVRLVCSKLCVLIFGFRGVLLIYSTSLQINAQSSYMTCALRCYYKEVEGILQLTDAQTLIPINWPCPQRAHLSWGEKKEL